MKKRFVKSLLGLLLASTLMIGEVGAVPAAEPQAVEEAAGNMTQVTAGEAEEAVTEEIAETKTDAVEAVEPEADKTVSAVGATTPQITYLNHSAYTYSRGEYIYFSGYASRVEVYVNNILYKIYYNDDTETGNAPFMSENFEFYNMIPGTVYTFSIIPYGSDNTRGVAKTFTADRHSLPTVSSSSCTVQKEVVYVDGKTTGYGRPYVSYSASLSNAMSGDKWELYRAEGKKDGTYKMVYTGTSSYGIYYQDYDVNPGKVYYYKLRYVSDTDKYVKTPVIGAFSNVAEADIGKPSVSCGVEYEDGMAFVYAGNYSFATGFEVYRSNSKTKGYKKLATISDTNYIDKTIKSGKTYYYKLKPFYYDTASRKKYEGTLSKPAGVKVLLGSIMATVKQTSATKVSLQWFKVAGADSYEIYSKTDMAGDAYKLMASTNRLSYTAKVGTDETRYFQIRAYKNERGVKKYYQSASYNVQTGLKAPANVRVTKKAVTIQGTTATIKATIKWDRVYGAKSYRIEAYDNVKGQRVVLKNGLKSSVTSYVLTNTVTGGESRYDYVYVYAVNGKDEYYNTCYSDSFDDLNAVAGVKVKRKSATSAAISWKKAAGADSYIVYRQSPTGYQIALGTTEQTSFIDTCLTPGVNYIYTIVARNSKAGIGSSQVYTEKETSGNVALYNHKLGTASISSVTNSSSRKATVTWKSAAYARSYVVYRATSKKGKYKKVGATTKTSFTDKKVSKGRTYYYKVEVVSVNDAGCTVTSEKSAAKSVKIKK